MNVDLFSDTDSDDDQQTPPPNHVALAEAAAREASNASHIAFEAASAAETAALDAAEASFDASSSARAAHAQADSACATARSVAALTTPECLDDTNDDYDDDDDDDDDDVSTEDETNLYPHAFNTGDNDYAIVPTSEPFSPDSSLLYGLLTNNGQYNSAQTLPLQIPPTLPMFGIVSPLHGQPCVVKKKCNYLYIIC